MKYFLILFFLFALPLWAVPIDRSSSTYQEHQPSKWRVDKYDFSGEFPNLENVDIDARRKKRVEVDLSGNYPLLASINYEGSFGNLKGDLTGNFPELTSINILCTSCAMQLDLTGQWQKSCQITIRGQKENIVIKLPEEVGLIIHTKIAPNGKVITKEGLKKQGWYHILNKTYKNELAQTAPVVITLNIETTDGQIVLN